MLCSDRVDGVPPVAALTDHGYLGIVGEQDAEVLPRQRLVIDDQGTNLLHRYSQTLGSPAVRARAKRDDDVHHEPARAPSAGAERVCAAVEMLEPRLRVAESNALTS